MRHNIDRYADLNGDKFAGWMVVTGIMAFISVLGLLMGLLPPPIPWLTYVSMAGLTPIVVHGALAATHVNRGLGGAQADLMQAYCKLPKSLRKDMQLTRDEVLTMTPMECNSMRFKINEAQTHFNRDIYGPVGRVNSILDSHITTYRELESME